MLGRKFFKTKLCKLFQGGRCPRENCSFAHGSAELRHATAPFNDRRDSRDYRSLDLRDKLDRRNSPQRRYSPGRGGRGYRAFQKPVSHDRGYSVSRSPVRRRHRKKQHLDGESNDSGSFKVSHGTEDQRKDSKEKVSSQGEKDVLEEQLKKVQLEIESLDEHKSQLETLLEEKDDEAHKFSRRIEDLEMQLNKEQDDCKRITSKIKKFIRAHGRCVKAQEEFKRSQARLERLGDQLGSDTLKPNANEEDSSVNITSDGERNGDKQRSPRIIELQNNSTIKKRQHVYATTSEEAHIGSSQKRKRVSTIITRPEKFSRAEEPLQSENGNKESEANNTVHTKKDVYKSLRDEYKHKRGKNSSGVAYLDKIKGSEMGHLLPSTSMAAHAVDELIEAIEMEDKVEGEATEVDENGAVNNRARLSYIPPLPPPPPPPVPQNAYKQYEDDDEDVDVEKVDTEMLDIDINSEVEIEQL